MEAMEEHLYSKDLKPKVDIILKLSQKQSTADASSLDQSHKKTENGILAPAAGPGASPESVMSHSTKLPHCF